MSEMTDDSTVAQSDTTATLAIDTSKPIVLKNRDAIDFQRVTGRKLVGALKELEAEREDPDWEIVTALLWIVGRKSDATFTYERALDADITVEQLTQIVRALADPTEPAAPANVVEAS